MSKRPTIVLVLRSGKDFTLKDVWLIERHINGLWKSMPRPRIICLYDKVSKHYDLGNIEFIPLTNDQPGTWSRIQLYSPEMEQYRPFLYIDLDTVVVRSLENIFALVGNGDKFITLEDFWQKGKLATGLVWFPANSEKVQAVWNNFKGANGSRMDKYLWSVVKADTYWQRLTDTIYDFKPSPGQVLRQVPANANLICFHGKPRIFAVAEASVSLDWVKEYVEKQFAFRLRDLKNVTVIIPYNRDRGWLKDAIASVPEGVQLILSKGDGNWPQNFNKALPQATGDYIKYLHEDDMLTPNCIEDSVNAIEEQKVDFIHGNALELHMKNKELRRYIPLVKVPTLTNMLAKNVIHSATLMYRKEVFEKVGGFDETLGVGVSEEYEFNLRCLKAGLMIGYCNADLGVYRRHPAQKIRTTPPKVQAKERAEVKSRYLK